jgi:DNA repair protein RecN (Recombination protein N)
MLMRLRINNIILLKQVEINFAAGLTVLTGETGAGKSILLDALGLILGKRADGGGKMVRYGEESGQVTAEFDISGNAPLLEWLTEQGIDDNDGLLIIRRTLKADGASKAFVNDQAVTQKMLQMLGEWLIVIHGQHDQRGLLEVAKHAQMLDDYAKLSDGLTKQVRASYANWQAAKRSLENLQQDLQNAQRESEYLVHVVAEIGKLKPRTGEEDELANERSKLLQMEKTGLLLQDNEKILSGGQTPIAEQLRRVQVAFLRSPIATTPSVSKIIDSLERCLHELEDAETTLHEYAREINYDEAALERISERLFALRELARKYRMSVDELPSYLSQAEEKLKQVIGGQEEIARLTKQTEALQAQFLALAAELRSARLLAIPQLCEAIHSNLQMLKMAATKVRVRCDALSIEQAKPNGIDDICFEVATNVGGHYGSLASIASGGELSRFMLAMAVVMNKRDNAPMLIFDEIDTGTGGAVADAIGLKLAELAQHQQVVVVTHLPQVAARANAHLFISKAVEDGATVTNVAPLTKAQSTEELARMLSGAIVTDEARMAAARLMKQA